MKQNTSPSQRFIQLLTQSQPRVFAYIMTLLPNPDAAQDILQETNLVLLQKFEEYDEQLDFVQWACGFVRFKVLAYHRDRGRDRLVFSEAALQRLTDAGTIGVDHWESIQSALRHCVEQLSETNRKIIAMRYGPHGSVTGTASRLGRSANAISVALSKIRKALGDCVAQTLEHEGGVA